MKIRNYLAAMLFFANGQYVSAQSFTIRGLVVGIADSTWIYVKPTQEDRYLDSALVINNRFTLSGLMQEEVQQVFLHTAQYKNYTSLWLENKEYNIFLREGKFKEALVVGSTIEREYKFYAARLSYYSKLEDSTRSWIKLSTDTSEQHLLRRELRQLQQETMQAEIDYVKQHPGSWIAANTLNIYKSSWDKTLVTELYSTLSDKMQQSSLGQSISQFLRINKVHKIGDPFTDFAQKNPQGKTIRLSDYKGKYVLLEFWGSWCQPCRAENPLLVSLYKKYKPKGFDILGVSLEIGRKEWLQAIKEDKIPWENVSELNGDENSAFLLYGLNAVPGNFLINDKGIIIARDLRGEKLAKKLEELLGK